VHASSVEACNDALVASIWRDPIVVTFVDEDNRELLRMTNPTYLPRTGENVRLAGTPYVVERVGYDVPAKAIDRVWIVCRPA
jgi:hypothetical protein